MIEIVKICPTHGNLSLADIYEEKMKEGLTFRLRCKKCRKEYSLKNKEKILMKRREYAAKKRKEPGFYGEKERMYAREWRRKNSKKINEKIRNDRIENPEKYRNYERNERAKNLLKYRELDVVNKHNITYEEYKWLCEKQKGLCAICKKPETRKSRTTGQICRLAIDHNHETKKIRELLCHNCNILVGHCRESTEILLSTIEYLQKHKHVK